MTKINFILASLLILMSTACSLPGSNDLNSPDEKEKDSRNRKYLESIYNPIRGEYTLQLNQEGDRSTLRCVVLNVDYKITEERKNSLGQPVYNVSLFGKYTDYDSFLSEVPLKGVLDENTGDVSFILEEQTSNKILEVYGKITDKNFSNGAVRIEGYPAGDMRAEIVSQKNCPSKDSLGREYSSKLEKMFAGSWAGFTETNETIAGFNIRLGIFITRYAKPDGGFAFDVTSNFEREPFGNLTPVSINIALNRNPVAVIFSGTNVKFFGSMVDAQTIKGTLVYPRATMKATLKRKQ